MKEMSQWKLITPTLSTVQSFFLELDVFVKF